MRILLLFLSLSHLTFAQDVKDPTALPADSAIRFGPPSMTMVAHPNLEYVSASPVAPLSNVFIRSMGNPLITVDGFPQIGPIFGTQPFREFVAFPPLLGFDIESINPQAYLNNRTIVSGVNSNSLDMKTANFSALEDSLKIFVNNNTLSMYQETASRGYSVVNNAGIVFRRRIVASRLSVNSSVMDNYIRQMGVRRYGVNGKVVLQPVNNLLLSAYLDYSLHNDFKRTDNSELDNMNSFSYLITEYDTRRFRLQAKASRSSRRETLFRQIVEVTNLGANPESTETYTHYVNYVSNGAYYEVNATVMPFRNSGRWSGDFMLGWKSWNIVEPNDVRDTTVRRNTIESYRRVLLRPELTDQKVYGDLRVKRGIISARYSFDVSRLSMGAINASMKRSDTVYFNHFGSLGVDFFHDSDSWLQTLNFLFRSGVIHHCFIGPYASAPGASTAWVNPQRSMQLEATLRFNAASSRLGGFVSAYSLHYDRYLSRWRTPDNMSLNYVPGAVNIGEVDKKGLETGWAARVVDREKIKGLLRGTLAWNKISMDPMIPDFGSDRAANRVVSLYSGWTFRSFDLTVIASHKNGFEIFRDDFGPTGDGPLIYLPLETGYIAKVDENGQPTLKSPAKFNMVHAISYSIVENIRLTYTIDGIWRGGKAVIGFDFNRLRTLYPYMNNIIEYMALGRAQVPSFYNVLGASVTLEF